MIFEITVTLTDGTETVRTVEAQSRAYAIRDARQESDVREVTAATQVD